MAYNVHYVSTNIINNNNKTLVNNNQTREFIHSLSLAVNYSAKHDNKMNKILGVGTNNSPTTENKQNMMKHIIQTSAPTKSKGGYSLVIISYM